jgi:hypothetical protein
LKKYKSPGIAQILAELIQAEDETLHCDIHNNLINSLWNKKKFSERWKESTVVPV